MRQRNKKTPSAATLRAKQENYSPKPKGNLEMYQNKTKVKRISMSVGSITIGLLLGQQDPETAKQRTLDSLRRHGWIVPGVNPSALVRRHHA